MSRPRPPPTRASPTEGSTPWKKGILVCTGVLLTWVGVEQGLRLALRHGTWDRLADPEAYFDPLCDEDYWRALGRGAWAESLHRPGSSEQDPVLGWVPDRRSLDAAGAWPTAGAPAQPARQIALFGDSYVFGTVPDGERLSDALQALRPTEQVLNFGVGGYGLDQILLHLEDRLEVLRPGDQVVLGRLTTDLDRTVLAVRDAPKPRFLLEDGELSLQPPSELSASDWFETHPIEAGSLIWARLGRTLDLWQSGDAPSTQPACRVEEKQALTRALLARADQTCTQADLDCLVVLFHRPIDLEHGAGWRAQVIKTASPGTRALLDTGPLLLQQDWRGLYGADSHPSAAGNQALAEWMDQALKMEVSEQ